MDLYQDAWGITAEPRAACSMNFATSSGRDSMGQWPARMDMMWSGGAARLAIIFCTVGSSILSSLAIWYHVGDCRHAGIPSICAVAKVADVGALAGGQCPGFCWLDILAGEVRDLVTLDDNERGILIGVHGHDVLRPGSRVPAKSSLSW
ncbi:MAG: hypothetical protein M3460_26950 [Actinomycetota bacterium]|nr:hypothetical protein [Actinomycetota bacterium]